MLVNILWNKNDIFFSLSTWSGLPSVRTYMACVLGSLSACRSAPMVLVEPLQDNPFTHVHAWLKFFSLTSINLSRHGAGRVSKLTKLIFCLCRNCSCENLKVPCLWYWNEIKSKFSKWYFDFELAISLQFKCYSLNMHAQSVTTALALMNGR